MVDRDRAAAPDREAHHAGAGTPEAEGADDGERPLSAPDPAARVREGKDPGWPVPGFPRPPTSADSPAADADAPAP